MSHTSVSQNAILQIIKQLYNEGKTEQEITQTMHECIHIIFNQQKMNLNQTNKTKLFNWNQFLKDNKIKKTEYLFNALKDIDENKLIQYNKQELNTFCLDVLKLDILNKKRFIQGILNLNTNNSIKRERIIFTEEKNAFDDLENRYKNINVLMQNIIMAMKSVDVCADRTVKSIEQEIDSIVQKIKQRQIVLRYREVDRIVKAKIDTLKAQLNDIKSKEISDVHGLQTAAKVGFRIDNKRVKQFFENGLFVNTFDSPYMVDIKIKNISCESINIKMGVKKIKNDPKSNVKYFEINIAKYKADNIDDDSHSDLIMNSKLKKVKELYKIINDDNMDEALLNEWKIFKSHENKYLIEGLKRNSCYILKVRGYNEYGFGDYSSTHLINTRSELFFKYENDFDTNGIIWYLGTNKGKHKTWLNPAINKMVSIESSPMYDFSYSNIKFISHFHNMQECCTKGESAGDYFIIDFNKRSIKPTHYTLRHDTNEGYYIRYWEFLGYMKHKKKWKLIKKHDNDPSINSPKGTHTWNVNSKHYYNKFKIIITGNDSEGDYYLICNGFEIYGYLRE